MNNFICNQCGEQLAILNTENFGKYKNLWMNNKARGDKYAICLHFLPHLLNIGRKFEFLTFQGSVAT